MCISRIIFPITIGNTQWGLQIQKKVNHLEYVARHNISQAFMRNECQIIGNKYILVLLVRYSIYSSHDFHVNSSTQNCSTCDTVS